MEFKILQKYLEKSKRVGVYLLSAAQTNLCWNYQKMNEYMIWVG